ncbi:hypothetical protein H6F61_20035 [Cyanobacteria bacterium FACHB-472]|nr:hypothetical protein [Cyanobacteria bacterium FACHB-472]
MQQQRIRMLYYLRPGKGEDGSVLVKTHCVQFATYLRCIAHSLYCTIKWAVECSTHKKRSRSVPKAIALLRAAETNVSDRSFHSCLRSRFYSFKISIVLITLQLCFQFSLLSAGRRLYKRLGCG